MLPDNLSDLTYWASIGTIGTVLVTFSIYTKKKVAKFKKELEGYNEIYEEKKALIEKITSKETTFQERLDIYIYVNSALGLYRHVEMRFRLFLVSANIISVLILVSYLVLISPYWVEFIYYEQTESFIGLALLALLVVATLIYFQIDYRREKIYFEKLSDGYIYGFINIVGEDINKKYRDRE